MSSPESEVSATAEKMMFAGVEVGDFASSEVQETFVRDSCTPASPARQPSPFIQDRGSSPARSPGFLEESDDEDCVVEVDAEQYYTATPVLARGFPFGNSMSTSFAGGNENARPGGEACFKALPKSDTVRDQPSSSVRITTLAPGGETMIPPNAEVITIESDDEEDEEKEEEHEDYYDPRDYYGEYYHDPEDKEISEDDSEHLNFGLQDGYEHTTAIEIIDDDDEQVEDDQAEDWNPDDEEDQVEQAELVDDQAEVENLGGEEFDDEEFEVENLNGEYFDDEEFEGEQVELVDEQDEIEQIDLTDDSSEAAYDCSAPNYPITSSPTAEDNHNATQSMLAMPDSPYEKAIDSQGMSGSVSASEIARDLSYIPGSPINKPKQLRHPNTDTPDWHLLLDEATGDVTDYTSTEAERDEIIRLYRKHQGCIPLIRADLPGSNYITHRTDVETRRIIHILQDAQNNGFIELLPAHQPNRQQSSEELRRRKRTLSDSAADGDETYCGDYVSNDGYEGDGPVRGPALDTASLTYDLNDTFDARFAKNLARVDGEPEMKRRRRGDDDLRRRGRGGLKPFLATSSAVCRLGEVTDFGDVE